MAEKRTFNADQRMAETTDSEITIDNQTFHPRARTGEIAKKLAKLGRAPQATEEDPESIGKMMDYLYKALAIVLRDKDGLSPDPDWLQTVLAFDVANEIMDFCSPDDAEGNVEALMGQITNLEVIDRDKLLDAMFELKAKSEPTKVLVEAPVEEVRVTVPQEPVTEPHPEVVTTS